MFQEIPTAPQKKCVCIHEIIQLIMKYDINRPRPTHGPKHSKYKYSLSMSMLICIKQHLRNI